MTKPSKAEMDYDINQVENTKFMLSSLPLTKYNRSHMGPRLESAGFQTSLIYCNETCVLCEKFRF